VSKKKLLTVVVAAIAVIVLALVPATSAQPTIVKTAKPAKTAKLQTIRLAVYPTLDYAPMYVGLKLGIFKKYGLDLKITYVYTGAGLFAAITSGQDDLATNSPATGANAISQGLPIRMLTAADYQPTKGNTEVLVAKNSSIKSYADLAGKTVATSSLHGLFNLGLNYAVQQAGKDPASMHILTVAPQDEGNAVLSGQLDAIVIQDPWLTQYLASGSYRSLGNPFGVFNYKLPIGAFWTSNSTIQSNPKLLLAFRAAWKACVAATATHQSTLKHVIPKYTGLDPSLVSKITIPTYTSGLAPNSLGPMLRLMHTYGWVGTPPSYNQIYWDGK
jgi:NitT/TauT family transport system substrate-binding protein